MKSVYKCIKNKNIQDDWGRGNNHTQESEKEEMCNYRGVTSMNHIANVKKKNILKRTKTPIKWRTVQASKK